MCSHATTSLQLVIYILAVGMLDTLFWHREYQYGPKLLDPIATLGLQETTA